MKFKAIWKDTFREITKSKMRFLAILTIILLGVAFYVGISATGPDMIATSDEYFEQLELMDYRVQSTYGLTDDDIELLENLEGASVQSHYAHDFLLEDASTIRVYSLDTKNGQEINKYYVLDGRLPEKSGEIAIDYKRHLREGTKVGDLITLETGESAGEPEEYLKQNTFEVVGLVNSPLFIEIESRGISSIGSGTLNAFGVISEIDYTTDIFTEAYIKLAKSNQYDAYSDEYDNYVDNFSPNLETTLDQLAVRRENNIQNEIQEELADGWAEIKEAKEELVDAETELADARVEIDDGWAELEEGKAELQQEIADAEQEINKNEQTLHEAAQELKTAKEKLVQQKKELQAEQANLIQNEKELLDGISQLETGILQMRDGKKQIDDGLAQINEGLNQIENERAEIQAGFTQIEKTKNALAKETEEAETELNQAESELQAAEAKLQESREQIDQGWQEFEAGQQALAEETEAAQEEIRLNEEKLNNSLIELNETEATLLQQKENLDAELATLVESEVALNNGIDELTTAITQIQEQLAQTENEAEQEELKIQLAQLESKLADLETQLATLTQGKEEINQGLTQIANTLAQIEENRAEIEGGFNEIEQAKQLLVEETNKAQAELDQAQAELEEAEALYEAELPDAQAQIEQGWQDLEQGKQELLAQTEPARDEIAANEQKLKDGLETLEAEQAKLIQQKEELETQRASLNEAELENQIAELEANLPQIADGKQQITDGLTQINEGLAQIEENEQDIKNGFSEIEKAKNTLREETEQAQRELADAETELNEAEADYQEGLETFENEREDALKEIADGKADLEEAEVDLEKLVMPEYMSFGRSDNFGYSEYQDNAERLSIIARVFPVFFFLIAIFISFTTMTRMVDEEREYIGIMKAMGYKNRYILIKFIVYAAIATIIGASLGLVIGYTLFPKLIFYAYSSLYNFPTVKLQQYTLYTVIALTFAFISTVGASLLAVRYSLRSNAARLLQPKPPKKGSRIWLEKINFIWNRLSFNYKITFRNVFRYKSRMLMTILGIAGSTGLILTGFGISDSVGDIPDIQYGEVNQFQAYVALNPNADSDELTDYRTISKDTDSITNDLFVLQQNVRAEKEGIITQDITFFIPEDPNKISEFIRLADYADHENIYDLDSSGAYITEKIARLLDIKTGDEFEVLNSDDEIWTAQVAGIVENYMGHFAYMTPEYYTEITGENYSQPDVQLIKFDKDVVDTDELGSRLIDAKAVAGIQYVDDIYDAFAGSIESLDLITQILVVSAAALAFIVLYNLTNINVSERSRELSTIKVLGSHDYEVTTYIYRENIILTFLGIVVGLGFGNILTKFIMETMEVDMLVFGRNIYFSSYMYSSLLTILFSLVVMIVIHFQLKKIDMVEALKGND